MNKILKTLMVLVTVFILVVSIYSFISTKTYDPGFKNQWYLENGETGVDINAKKMWRVLEKKPSQNEVVVAVIDTGVNYTYDELVDTQWINDDEIALNGIDDDNNGFIDDIYGWSFADNKPFDISMIESNHGTICAGIIAARHNGKGVEGVTKNRNIKIMSIKVLSSEQSVGEGPPCGRGYFLCRKKWS